MPVISAFYGILIKMFFQDHLPPHFHAEYGDNKALIGIENFEVVKGSLPPKALALVVEWAVLHQNELRDNWKTMIEYENKSFKKIEPLK